MDKNATTPSMTITQTGRTNFSSLWLKYVNAVDLDTHCINSLIGGRQAGIDRRSTESVLMLDQFPQPAAWYLCGVTYPYRWDRNLHVLAFPAPGEREIIETVGVTVTLNNAVSVEITDEWIDPSDPHAFERSFKTCRNWQAAWMLSRRLGVPVEHNPDRDRRWKSKRKKGYEAESLF